MIFNKQNIMKGNIIMNCFLFEKIFEYLRFKQIKIKFKEDYCIEQSIHSVSIYDNENKLLQTFSMSENDVKLMKLMLQIENLNDTIVK